MAKQSSVALLGFLALFGYLSYLVLKPFLSFVVLALVLAFLFYPLYKFLSKKIKPVASSLLVLFIILLSIVIPGIYLAGSLFVQASNAYQTVQAQGLVVFDESSVSDYLEKWLGVEVRGEVSELFDKGREFVKSSIPSIITGTGLLLLGIFLMFFVAFYALIDGDKWFEKVISWLPLEKKHCKSLCDKIRVEAKALLYGWIVTSVLVGVINGTILGMAGLPDPVFWGFLMIILGIVPVIGAFIVYIPASIYLMSTNLVLGIIVLVLCLSVQLIVDYIIRPKMVRRASEMHPTFVVLGALGGIALMGVVGFLVGPIILNFFVTLMSYSNESQQVQRRK